MSGFEGGELLLTSLYDDGRLSGFRVDRADPYVRVYAEFVDEEFAADEGFADAAIATFADGVMTINGVNRRVVYRVDPDSYDALTHTYLMSWPD